MSSRVAGNISSSSADQAHSKLSEWSMKRNIVFILGIVIRLGWLSLGYNDHNDNSGSIKYTDIDYFVFTDAAYYILQGGSPYERITYRYTPIMAYLVIPNHLVHPMFGKVLFTIVDMLVVLVIRKILQTQYGEKAIEYQNILDSWIAINPFWFFISTRGSNDIIVGFVVTLWLYLLIKRYFVIAGALFGLSVHLKIYPIIYGFPLILFIDRQKGTIHRASVLINPKSWFTGRKLKFFGTSAIVFFLLGTIFYKMYGFKFIYEAYIYHSLRVDHRHNFSFNYLFEYYHYDELPEVKHLVRKLSFVAQWGLVSFVGIRYYYDLLAAITLQTFLFVIFNRVITAQYFLWFSILLPLIAIKIKGLFNIKTIISVSLLFFASEMFVNLSWMPLELFGQPSYDFIFFATHTFLVSNVMLAYKMIQKIEFKETLYIHEQYENVYPEMYTFKIPSKDKQKVKTD